MNPLDFVIIIKMLGTVFGLCKNLCRPSDKSHNHKVNWLNLSLYKYGVAFIKCQAACQEQKEISDYFFFANISVSHYFRTLMNADER